MRSFVRAYEEFTGESAFEHINPNLIQRVYVHSEAESTVYVAIEWLGQNHSIMEEEDLEIPLYPFVDYKEAHRFIKRIGAVS